MLTPEERQDRRMQAIRALGRESALKISCFQLPRPRHKARLSLTIKGEISKGVTLYGYDGVDNFGHAHSITFTRSREVLGTCSVCRAVDVPDKDNKCTHCGAKIASLAKVTRDKYAEPAQRGNVRPKRKLGSAIAEEGVGYDE